MAKYKEEEINHIFHALADPTRREILRLVSKKERKASELASSFDMAFPSVSKHLKVLEKAKLITREVDGRIHRFSLQVETMKKADKWIKFYRRFWLDSLDHLGDFLEKQEKRRKDV